MVLGDSLFRSALLKDMAVALVYSLFACLGAFILLFIALSTAAYTHIDFPTGNAGQYGFLMTAVQSRVPLASSRGGAVSPPIYNPNYQSFGDPGAPINASVHYGGTVPFSTSRWWSRLATEKSPQWVTTMPYTYTGVFSLYRSVATPSFAICIDRPYSYFANPINASNVCGQVLEGMFKTRAHAVFDGAPTCFVAPALWNLTLQRPYNISNGECIYRVREVGTMSAEMTYASSDGSAVTRITLSQLTPYVLLSLSAGSTVCLNTYFRDSTMEYERIPLFDFASTAPIGVPTPTSHMVLRTVPISPQLGRTPVGISQTSIIRFEVAIDPPALVTRLLNGELLVTSDITQPQVVIRVLPVEYYIAAPQNPLQHTHWVSIDSRVSGVIFQSAPTTALTAFISSTSRNGVCTLTYASASGGGGQPIIFIPSLSMTSVGTILRAAPIPALIEPDGNEWLTPQGLTSIYIATSGSFDVEYPLIEPPPLGKFDIYPAFDVSSLHRLNTIFNRDLQALSAVDLANDSFYTSVRKIFTFAQMTYSLFNFPANYVVNVYLPPLMNHLTQVFGDLITSNRDALRMGYSSSLFTVATGDPDYGSSQNAVFGDNHVGQYGMILFIYYIIVSIQPDNTARRYARDLYQSVMIDLMRDFAQPYNTDQFIPAMRHFDYGVGISWQTSSIIEGTSMQVAEVLNGYYASWLVSQLFGDSKLRDFYRAILSVELATHREYRLAPLLGGTGGGSAVATMIQRAGRIFGNISSSAIENGVGNPGFYSPSGLTTFLIQNGEIVLHGVRNDHPDYRYLVELSSPNNSVDFSVGTFFRPMTPLTMTFVDLTLGTALSAFLTTSLEQMRVSSTLGASAPLVATGSTSPEVDAYEITTQLPVSVLSQSPNPSSFITIQAAYSLAAYARDYVENYTWAGANLPEGTCAVIPIANLPQYLEPTIQYNKLGPLDSNTVYWMFYVIAAYGPRK